MKGRCFAIAVVLSIRLSVFPVALIAMLAASTQICAAPVIASLKAILAAPTQGADDLPFRLYRWDRFPSILVFDTVDYNYQDKMFSRLAFFLEKRGFRGRLLYDSQLEKMHSWNAHDYSAYGISSFFNAAQLAAFPLNPEELTLRNIALEEGVLTTFHDHFAPGSGGVLSISRSSFQIERQLLLIHESFHGIFFDSPEYRAFCFQLWDSLDPRARVFFTRFLDELGYDAEYRYLAVNEFQAYLMQQPLKYAPAYFERVMKRFGRDKIAPVKAILNASLRLNAFLESWFGIRAGGTLEARGRSRKSL